MISVSAPSDRLVPPPTRPQPTRVDPCYAGTSTTLNMISQSLDERFHLFSESLLWVGRINSLIQCVVTYRGACPWTDQQVGSSADPPLLD